MPSSTDLSEQNIKDRYYGVNDPVAEKILKRMQDLPNLTPPEDPSITTLYIGSIPSGTMEADLRDVFYAYGELTSVRIIHDKNCAFVTYSKREDAERAANALASQLKINGVNCKLMWSRPNNQKTTSTAEPGSSAQGAGVLYPSMDPTAMGSFHPQAPGTKRGLVVEEGQSKKAKVDGIGRNQTPSGFKVTTPNEDLKTKIPRRIPRPRPPPGPPPST